MESEWNTVEEFVESLGTAITEEMRTIRETELDRAGGFKDSKVCQAGKVRDEKVFVDKLGRVITPHGTEWEDLSYIELRDDVRRAVVRSEPRYEGDSPVALVHYLERGKEVHDGAN